MFFAKEDTFKIGMSRNIIEYAPELRPNQASTTASKYLGNEISG